MPLYPPKSGFDQLQLLPAWRPSRFRPRSRKPNRSRLSFKSIGNQEDRSRAIFTEIGKLLTSPRCMNCHPAGDHPLHCAEHREHLPPAWRGESGTGVPGASCTMCHTGGNFTLHEAATYQSIPGHPRWQLAPLSMSWEGKTIGDICRQLKLDLSSIADIDLGCARANGSARRGLNAAYKTELNELMCVLPGTSIGELHANYFVAAWRTCRPHYRFVAVARHLVDNVFVAVPSVMAVGAPMSASQQIE